MDGLIKGLMDVALDHLGQKDDESRDERSRSSWAEVITTPYVFLGRLHVLHSLVLMYV